MQVFSSAQLRGSNGSATFRHMVLESPRARAGVLGFAEGEVVRPHLHARSDELFLILDGSVEFRIDSNEPQTLTAGDVIWLDEGELHSLIVTSGPAVLLAVVAPNLADDFYPDQP